jgi:outer membrane protein assembly factor BamB
VLGGQVIAELKPGVLSSIDPRTRKATWTTPIDTSAPPGLPRGVAVRPVLRGDHILVGTKAGRVYSLDRRTGKESWSYSKGNASVEGFNLDVERIYAAFDDGTVVALSVNTGKPMWTYYSRAGLFGNPLVNEGRLFLGSTSGHVHSVGLLDGRALWKTPLSYQVNIGLSQPIAFRDGILVANRKALVAFARDGTIRWQADIGIDMNGRAPRMLGNDLLLSGSHALYRMSVSGQ